jgi:hypothetical protein
LIDCYIALDRIAIFEKRVSAFFKYTPLKMSLIALVISIMIQAPCLLITIPATATVKLNAGVDYQLWFLYLSDYALSRTGQIFQFIVCGVRDLGTLVLLLVLSAISIFYFRVHLRMRRKLNPYPQQLSNVAKLLSQVSPSRLGAVTHDSNPISLSRKSRRPNISSAERNATRMCVFICLLTLVEHVALLACNIFPYFSSDSFKGYLYWIASMTMALKHALNFFLFVTFNKRFRRGVIGVLKLQIL